MISFKKFYEEFRANNKEEFGIFKNPTKEELEKLLPNVRGIVTAKGDFYVSNMNMGHGSLHTKMGERSAFLYKDKTIMKVLSDFDVKTGITVQRVESSNVFALGESEDLEDNLPVDQKKKLKIIFQKAKKLNPKIKFTAKNIEMF